MTAQMSDDVVWRGREYALTESDGGPLFDPAAYGLELRMISTACWRGYICRYAVEADELLLTGLQLGMDDPPPELFGVNRTDYEVGGAVSFEPIRVPMPFTGRLLIGDGFIHELYVHAGFHPAWKFRDVHELLFESGRLVAHHDRSAAMAEERSNRRPAR